MPQFFLLGAKVLLGVGAWSDLARHALHNSDAGSFQSFDLVGIVREQPYTGDAESL